MADLPHSWVAYGRLQVELSRGHRINVQSLGIEAALNHILASSQDNQLPSAEEASRAADTARRRERHRAHLRSVYLADTDNADVSPSPEDTVIARLGLNAIRSRVSEKDWTILSEVAAGRDYAEVAAVFGGTTGSLRVRVLRLRQRLAKAA